MNKKNLGVLCCALMISVAGLHAQDVAWKKNFGGSDREEFYDLTAVPGGYVAVGYGRVGTFNTGDWAGITGKGEVDAIIVKYDTEGNVLWKKNFGGSAQDVFESVTTVSDGVVAVGHSYPNSFGNGDWAGVTGKGAVDGIVVKFNNDGNVVWKKHFGANQGDWFRRVVTVSDGVVLVGESWAFDNGDWAGVKKKEGMTNGIIIKYDNAGNVVWKKNFGGSVGDLFLGATAVSDGIIVVGNCAFYSNASFNIDDWAGAKMIGVREASIVKYDHSGNIVWNKYFGGVEWDEFIAVTEVSDGYVAVGRSYNASFNTGDWAGVAGKGSEDAIIVKFNKSGAVVWKKHFGGSQLDRFSAVVTLPDDEVLAAGFSDNLNGDWGAITGKGRDATLVKYDKNGNVAWKKNFGGSSGDQFYNVITIPDGIVAAGYAAAGSFGNGDWVGVTSKGEWDAIIAKFSTNTVDNAAIQGVTSLRVYPNPTTGQLTVSGTNLKGAEVYDLTGRKQPAENSKANDGIRINISHLSAGIYFLKIQTEEGTVTKKIIKKHE